MPMPTSEELHVYAPFLAYLNHGKGYLQQIEQALQQLALTQHN